MPAFQPVDNLQDIITLFFFENYIRIVGGVKLESKT